MVRSGSVFVCQQCSYETSKWFGKCPDCGSWNTAVETLLRQVSGRASSGKNNQRSQLADVVRLSEVKKKFTERISTKISELDRVLGGGIVSGQVILIAGEPGIGKSTLLLQVANELSANRLRTTAGKRKSKQSTVDDTLPAVLYASGEESANQIKIRAERLGIKGDGIQLLDETNIDSISDTIATFKGGSLKGVIIDSIQTMQTSDLSGMAGSVGQVRECAYRLVKLAKSTGIPIFIVGHVTKQGSVAGPSVLMHLVDTVLWFEGDKTLTFRMLRAVKNRFGATDEVGIFEMEDKGLIGASDPEKVFLSEEKENVPGKVISVIVNGTRPIFVEIQALVVPTKLAIPRRVAQGIDSKKLELLLAVLTKRLGVRLYESDVFVNIAGGITVKNDPSVDLGVCAAILSSNYDKPFTQNSIFFGEVSLLGDVKTVSFEEKRTKEAKRLGYKNINYGRNIRDLKGLQKLLK